MRPVKKYRNQIADAPSSPMVSVPEPMSETIKGNDQDDFQGKHLPRPSARHYAEHPPGNKTESESNFTSISSLSKFNALAIPESKHDLPLLAFIGDTSAPTTAPESPPVQQPPNKHGIRDILIGEAGQNVVMARLLGMGIPAQSAMPGVAYDVIADIGRAGLYRIQVKTTATLSNGEYRFVMKRGFLRSKRGRFAYAQHDFDIAAFVCLPMFQVCFKASPIRGFAARPDFFKYQELARESLMEAIIGRRQNQGPRLKNRPLQSPRRVSSIRGLFQ